MPARQSSLALVLAAFGMPLISTPVFGCSCVAPPPGISSATQLAERSAGRVDAIFEGTAIEARMKSTFLDADVGSIVPASLDEDPPRVLITFSETHFYKGTQAKTVEVETGLGGGDCGFQFDKGMRYLVYSYKGDHGELSTGICTATAPVEESAANLAYLKGEPVPSEDQLKRARSGKLCGRVVADGQRGSDDDTRVMFVRNGSTSPMPHDEAELDEKGNFCADLDPGKYRLVFTNTLGEDTVTSYVYYPGTMEQSDAAQITLNSGESISDLVFRIPPQETFSVSGVVSLSDNSKVPDTTKVILISADRPFEGPTYSADVLVNGTFALPKVLPGKYWALLDVDTDADSSNAKLTTIKTEVLINGDVNQLALELIRGQ